jgi:hypothetical protein
MSDLIKTPQKRGGGGGGGVRTKEANVGLKGKKKKLHLNKVRKF